MKFKKYGVVILCIAAAAILIINSGGMRLQVQLRIVRGDSQHVVNAAAVGTVSHLHGGGDEKGIRFRNGSVKIDMGYGVTNVQGCFSKEDIQSAWPDASLTQDWPFAMSVFNTGSDLKRNIWISVKCDVESGMASAMLYMFYDRSSEPVVWHWEGMIGERIVLVGEI